MKKQIQDILRQAKENEGRDFFGVNFYRGRFYKTCVGAVKKISQKEAYNIIEQNLSE